MFILSWNELVVPLIISTRPEVMTIPVLLASLVSDKFLFFTLMMAICLIALTPSVLLALLLRKYVVKGLISGALKG
jgi:multiple sugar transport system permease protein